ncbi:lamin tail domain-containing protein [Streptomyces sp. NBC_01373]|uniref:lamin tail domain-containing protein n=1 Tax=Streptomyces sp. NBC_01373 TaxID=2903843 RepID=UPI0022552ECD|nr:lamin tail domain-containing protein [Streptomyces sp. NBC_01373]MCX4704334.1 lamin tail domain-containing protein [Streptomyces sp. NBC_01373]MCX4706994.1 lamin tail domain-containing protein [Streptomyces sp. NBC_01373]
MSVSTVTVRRLAAVPLAAAAVIGAVALPASAADHPRADRTRVEISSVQYDSPGRDNRSNRSLNKEWVELSNASRYSVNLDGWTLTDEDGRTYTFDGYRLDGRATVRIHTGEGRDTRTDLFQDRRHYVWDNDSDTATLRNHRGRFIDDASWGSDRHHHGDHHDHGRSDRSDRSEHGDRSEHHGDRSGHHGDRSGHHGDRSGHGDRGHHHGDRFHG